MKFQIFTVIHFFLFYAFLRTQNISFNFRSCFFMFYCEKNNFQYVFQIFIKIIVNNFSCVLILSSRVYFALKRVKKYFFSKFTIIFLMIFFSDLVKELIKYVFPLCTVKKKYILILLVLFIFFLFRILTS